MRPVWLDGSIVPFDSARVSVHAQSIQRGSLVFDVGTFHATSRGAAAFRMREHVVRFRRSAGIVGLALAHDDDALIDATCAVVRASGLTEGLIRWSAFFPNMETDVVPLDPAASVAILAYAASDRPSRPKPPAMRIAIYDDARKAAPEAIPPIAKVGASYLGPMLARARALREGYDEVVLLDRDGNVAEGPTSNVFAIAGGELVTPPLGYVLDGITRDSVMTIARGEGIRVREEPLTTRELSQADEAFLTASSMPIAAIGSVNGAAVGSGAMGAITRTLKERLVAAQHGKDDRYARWVTPIEGDRAPTTASRASR